MKHIIGIGVTCIIVIFIGFIIYWNLPIEITRKSDIRFGNELVLKIKKYQKEQARLPEENDWKLFEDLGFKMDLTGIKPSYSKVSDNEYELIYFEGFDGPYLIYNSAEETWKFDFPKNPTVSINLWQQR